MLLVTGIAPKCGLEFSVSVDCHNGSHNIPRNPRLDSWYKYDGHWIKFYADTDSGVLGTSASGVDVVWNGFTLYAA